MKYIDVIIQKIENNNDDITLVLDLPYDVMCLFLEVTKYISPRLNN